MSSSTFMPSQLYSPTTSFRSYNGTTSGNPSPFSQSFHDNDNPDDTELISVSWNQDQSCFAAAMSQGFRIYNCEPFKETFRRVLKDGGFVIVEMLFRCNILALVGAGANSQCSPNKVFIWDDHQSRCIGEFSFRSEVRAVKLRRGQIAVVLEHKIYVYNLVDLKLLHQIETVSNTRGLCCLSHHVSACVLACPGLRKGEVRVEFFGMNVTKIVQAHDSQIACLSLTIDGLILATASVKGTLIRVYSTMNGTCLQEVRRGTYKASIYGIAFSPNVRWLAVSSNKGTVHIFNLRVRGVVGGGEDAAIRSGFLQSPSYMYQSSSSSSLFTSPDYIDNRGSSLSFMKGYLPKYFSSEWSFARFHFPESARFIVAFGTNNSVMMVGLDGSFYRCTFDPVNGGEMLQEEYFRFIKTDKV